MNWRWIIGWVCLLTVTTAHGRVNVVTLPERNSVQLTIYNSVDLTLVKETRRLTFRKGLNRLEFSWANTLIDPSSLELKALNPADGIEILDVSFPPRIPNTLEWRIQSEIAGEVLCEIRYFTSGISWSADYVTEANATEQRMKLSGAVRVSNHSGEDYENAEVRLVVGVIRLVEDIAALARAGEINYNSPTPTTAMFKNQRALGAKAAMAFDSAVAMGEEALKEKRVVKEAFSEYFLFSVEGRDTIPNGWSKRMPSFAAPDVAVTSLYKYERELTGDLVTRFYRFTNSVAANLGKEPLPDGVLYAFRFGNAEGLYRFVGQTAVKYIPVGEMVELNLGADPEVFVRPALTNWEKTNLAFDNSGNVSGSTTKETWQIELQNSRDVPVLVDIRRNFSGDWAVQTDRAYEKVDANKVKFMVPLKPREKVVFTYQLTARLGTSRTR